MLIDGVIERFVVDIYVIVFAFGFYLLFSLSVCVSVSTSARVFDLSQSSENVDKGNKKRARVTRHAVAEIAIF